MSNADRIIVIGTSAGGVEALRRLITAFDPLWAVAVFVTIHTGANRNVMPEILNQTSRLNVQLAEHGKAIGRGVYVAPPDRHLVIGATNMFLSRGPTENYARPAIDPMFRTAARHHGTSVIGVLLTGYLYDGMNGLYEVGRQGGRTIVQDPMDAEVPDLPLNALRRIDPDYVIPLAQIPKAIGRELAQTTGAELRRLT